MSTRPGHGRGKKPANLMAGRRDNRTVIWAVIRRMRHFTHADLCHEIRVETGYSINDATVRSYLQQLERGLVIDVERRESVRGVAARKLYCFSNLGNFLAHKSEPPLFDADGHLRQARPTATDNMWRTMRVLKRFTHRDLAVMARTEEVGVAFDTARDYCKRLHAAGYLAVVDNNNGVHSIRTYALIPSKWSGPQAPMIQRIKAVYDPNLGRVVWPPEVANG